MTDVNAISIPREPGVGEDPKSLEARSRSYRLLMNVEQTVAALLLLTLFVVIVAQVTARYVFNSPIAGSEELARFTFIWFTFIAATFVGARRKHITVQLFSGGKTGRIGAAAEIFAYVVMVAVSVSLVIGGAIMVHTMWDIASPALELPYRFIYTALPIGFVLIGIHAVVNMILAFKHPEQFAGSSDVETAGL